MQQFEKEYAKLIRRIMGEGVTKEGRNGKTKSIFGMSIEIDCLEHTFPIIQGRKYYPRGVFGEFAAMLRRPTCVEDFEKWGCNYWSLWSDEQRKLKIDYGNAWFDFEGYNQIAALKKALKSNPNDRRMIVSGWRPHKLEELSLPCCHYSYQFNVSNGTLNMIWTQRSVDMMIGLPADIILAALWVIMLANEFGLRPGKVKMDLGDCHVYKEHFDQAYEYVYRVLEGNYMLKAPTYMLKARKGKDFCLFEPSDIVLSVFGSLPAMQLELKE